MKVMTAIAGLLMVGAVTAADMPMMDKITCDKAMAACGTDQDCKTALAAKGCHPPKP